MPTPTLHLDAIKGSQLEHNPSYTRLTRMGFIKNLDITSTPDPDALMKTLALLPSFGDQLSVAFPQMKMRSLRVRPEESSKTMARVELTYDTLGPSFTATAYIIRDRSYSVPRNDCFLPGSRLPVLVGFTNSTTAGFSLPPAPVFFNFTTTARALQLTVLQYGRPEGGAGDYVNYVNHASWPTGNATFNGGSYNPSGQLVRTATGLAKGYWKLSQYSSEYNQNAGMSLIQSEAITQVIEDWSVVGMLRNEQTGKYPFASLDAATITSIQTAMLTPAYSHGIIYPTGGTEHKGIVRAGPYPTTNFATLFGF